MTTNSVSRRIISASIIVAALGYFVDIYDLVLFSIVRIPSLAALGLTGEQIDAVGKALLQYQMGGMLIGGILWGVLGDRRGRLSVLFGSIAMYSVANILNGMVHSVEAYGWLRFFAGIGLAGELGAGITLVSEIMSKETRAYGTTIVATVGILGAVVAFLVGDFFDWRIAYYVGGGLGLALLILRIGVYESGMFSSIRASSVSRGNFFTLFTSWDRFSKYVKCILIGMPTWFVVGILITFANQFGVAHGIKPVPQPGKAIMFCYIGIAAGDLCSGLLSQFLASRRKVMLLFLLMTAASITYFLLMGSVSLTHFYAVCGALGFSAGFWAVFVTIGSEQFGTNIRATVATTVPNFVRGAVVPIVAAFTYFSKGMELGPIAAAGIVGGATVVVALAALAFLEETHGKDLDYVEVS